MKITWLGQAGLLFESEGKTLVIDPYLSDSVVKINPRNYRRVPADESFFDLRPDLLLCTHDHLDHLDPETLCHYFTPDSHMTVFAPESCFRTLLGFPGRNNVVLFRPGTQWSEGPFRLTATFAEHSDYCAVGAVIEAEGKAYYVTGDTLYSERVFASLPAVDLYAVFLPVNGVGNNMNFADGARFAARTGAKYAVPLHVGLFDQLRGDQFPAPNKVVPEFYRQIRFPEE